MPGNKDVSTTKRASIYSCLQNTEFSNREIARRHNVSEATVRRVKLRCSATDCPGSPQKYSSKRTGRCGRKRRLSTRDTTLMVREVKKKRQVSSNEVRRSLEQHGVRVSARTVRRRLNEQGFHSVVSLKKPRINAAMMRKRLEFARNYQHYTVEDWEKVNTD